MDIIEWNGLTLTSLTTYRNSHSSLSLRSTMCEVSFSAVSLLVEVLFGLFLGVFYKWIQPPKQ